MFPRRLVATTGEQAQLGNEHFAFAGFRLLGFGDFLFYLIHVQLFDPSDELLEGGGGERPEPQPPAPDRPLRLAAWLARKACEPHVIVNLLAVIAIAQLALGDGRLIVGSISLALMAPTAAAVAGWTIVRSQQQDTTEREFAAWFRPSRGEEIVFLDGWWFVRPAKDDCATGE